jgi:hypothetical protein
MLSLIAPGLAGAGEAPKVGADGSLVLESGKDSRKSGASGDTLYDMLGQEVQVFIFKHKTRVWPQTTMRSASWTYRGSAPGRRDPRLDALINKYAGAYEVDPALVRAVMRNESGFNSQAVSPKGAQGLMQLMPGTAALMGVKDPFDPEQNIAGGVGYLRRCLDRFGHNVPLAVAAYNAGPEAVAKYCSIPPYQETQLFVNNVMGSYGAYGPNQGLNNPAARLPSPEPNKAVKGAAAKDAEAPVKDPNTPRRPRAKIIEVRPGKAQTRIIEVRSNKVQTRAIPILKD